MILKENVDNDFKNIFLQMKKCHSGSKLDRLMVDYFELLDMCSQLDYEDVPNIDFYCSKPIKIVTDVCNMQGFFNNLDKNIDYHSKVAKLNRSFKNLKIDLGESKRELSEVEAIQMTLDFYKAYDVLIYDKLVKMMDLNRIHFKIIESDSRSGLSYLSLASYDPYIIIFSNKNIIDAISLVHEVGHITYYNILKNNRNYYNNPSRTSYFDELYSYFFEMAFVSELENQGIYDANFKNNLISELLELSYAFQEILAYISGDFNIDPYHALTTSYGILLAFHYHEMYLDDKEKAKYYIKHIMEESFYYDPIECIDRYGLSKEDVASGRIIKKYIKKANEYTIC